VDRRIARDQPRRPQPPRRTTSGTRSDSSARNQIACAGYPLRTIRATTRCARTRRGANGSPHRNGLRIGRQRLDRVQHPHLEQGQHRLPEQPARECAALVVTARSPPPNKLQAPRPRTNAACLLGHEGPSRIARHRKAKRAGPVRRASLRSGKTMGSGPVSSPFPATDPRVRTRSADRASPDSRPGSTPDRARPSRSLPRR